MILKMFANELLLNELLSAGEFDIVFGAVSEWKIGL